MKFRGAKRINYQHSQEITSINGKRLPDFVSLDIRVDYKIQMRKYDLTLFLDITDIQTNFNLTAEQFIALTGEQILRIFDFSVWVESKVRKVSISEIIKSRIAS